jgi:nucleoside-diphosphate-sugar epimerase
LQINPADTCSELTIHKPTRVINTAGVRGTPNADWCEDNKIETFRSNVLGALNVVDCCYQLGIHVTQFGSACIYNLPEKEVRNRAPFTEKEEPFFKGAWYHRSRLLSEQTIGHYPNLLLLRMRIPLAADLHRNNHIARLLRYDKIVDLTGVSTSLHPDCDMDHCLISM